MPHVLGEGPEAVEAIPAGKKIVAETNGRRLMQVVWVERAVNKGARRGVTKSAKKRRKK